MLKSEEHMSDVRHRMPASGKRLACLMLLSLFSLLFAGCRQDMQDQPRYEVYESSRFFRDGLSSRPLVEGTVPRGYLHDDSLLYTGKTRSAPLATQNSGASGQGAGQSRQAAENSTPQHGTAQSNPTTTMASGVNAQQAGGTTGEADSTLFPFPVTEQVLERGQERYQIFCAVCHGMTGDGDGMIVRRGYRKPPSYYTPELRIAPVGHFFDVVTNGWGAMPNYAQQIPATDRWAIIAYIRALQATRPQSASPAQGATLPQQQPAQTGGQR